MGRLPHRLPTLSPPFLDSLDAWDGRLPATLVAPAADPAARRALLRGLVARALARDRLSVEIVHADGHPPRLLRPADTVLHLSAAARDGLAALAVAEAPVGIDVEVVDEGASIPWNVLHPDEAASLRAVSPTDAATRFTGLWAVKEAYLKALGLGLSREPAGFAVRVEGVRAEIDDPGGPEVCVDLAWRPFRGRRFAVARVLVGVA